VASLTELSWAVSYENMRSQLLRGVAYLPGDEPDVERERIERAGPQELAGMLRTMPEVPFEDFARWPEGRWRVERARIVLEQLDPALSTWCAGWAYRGPLLVVGLCSEVERHSAELRAMTKEPYRLSFFPGTVPLARLERAEEELWSLGALSDRVSEACIDLEQNCLDVGTDQPDPAGLEAELKARLGVPLGVSSAGRATLAGD
jgi:hypothetical protein